MRGSVCIAPGGWSSAKPHLCSKPIANWLKDSQRGWPMLIHFPKKSQERSQEVHAYEDENFRVPSQLSTPIEPQQAMAGRGCDHHVPDSREHARSRNRRPSVAASYHHKHSPRPDWRGIERNAEGQCRSQQFSPADYLAVGVNQPDKSICEDRK